MELKNLERPHITHYENPEDFLRDMLAFKRKSELGFSVLKASKNLRKISPSLVTLILQRKRKITLDRVDELSKLMGLNSTEKFYLKDWISKTAVGKSAPVINLPLEKKSSSRKEASTHILSDWINVYVKDCFQIPEISKNPKLIYKHLATIATQKRVDNSVKFLLREGYLRKTLNGEIVVETNLTITDPQIPQKKIKQFHKNALNLAKGAMDLYPAHERYANTFLMPLTPETYSELLNLIRDFANNLNEFAESRAQQGENLHQIIINLSPTKGASS